MQEYNKRLVYLAAFILAGDKKQLKKVFDKWKYYNRVPSRNKAESVIKRQGRTIKLTAADFEFNRSMVCI